MKGTLTEIKYFLHCYKQIYCTIRSTKKSTLTSHQMLALILLLSYVCSSPLPFNLSDSQKEAGIALGAVAALAGAAYLHSSKAAMQVEEGLLFCHPCDGAPLAAPLASKMKVPKIKKVKLRAKKT